MTKTSPPAGKRKPQGYWEDSANVISEAGRVAAEHGPEALTRTWLCANGHSGLSNAITKHGGIAWIRAELGLEQGMKPMGYWSDSANVISEAGRVAAEHGPEALTQKWLNANGYSGLSNAISRNGGYAWIRAELGLEQGMKPLGYWNDPARVLTEAKALIAAFGPKALTAAWLKANGHSGLSTAISRNGGIAWIRAELGLEQGMKPSGYWNDPANAISEATALVRVWGPEALTQKWLNANGYSGLSNAITKHGGIAWIRAELGLEQGMKPLGYWNDPANAISEATALVRVWGPEALTATWLKANGHCSLANAIAKHGGIAWIRAELGLEQGRKPLGYWDDPANVISEATALVRVWGPSALTDNWLRANGHSGLSNAISEHGGITWLRAELGVEAPARPSFGDSVQHALDCTGHHTEARDSDFYIYDLRNFSGFIKPGIAFDVVDRVRKSEGQYGEELYLKTLNTRQEAYFLEQAILDATRGCAGYPDALAGWAGATEVRAMDPADLIQVADRLLAELEELGVWEFAAKWVPMTAAQRAICQQRALTGAPACAAAAA